VLIVDAWRKALLSCGDEALATTLIASIEDLFAREGYSLAIDASERHIAALLARSLEHRAPSHPMDNRGWSMWSTTATAEQLRQVPVGRAT